MPSLPLGGAGPTGPGVNFTPTDITGLLMWYKADAGTSTTTDGVGVSQWNDQSGNARTLTQGTGANQPLYKAAQVNGQPALSFDGSNDFLATAAGLALKPVSMFVVCNATASVAARTMIGNAGSGPMQFRIDGTDKLNILSQGTANIGSQTGTITEGAWFVAAATYDGSGNYAFYQNGTADGSGLNNQAIGAGTAVRIGIADLTNEPFFGLIAEVLAYDTVLSAGNRSSVTSYLGSKYGITVA